MKWDQPWLLGFAPSLFLDSLFFAILAPPEPTRQIAGLASVLRHQHRLRGRLRSRLHVSLQPVCQAEELPKASIAAARAAGAQVSLPSFDMILDRVMSFTGRPENRAVVLCPGGEIPALMALQRALGAAMAASGLDAHPSSAFVPHLTVLYDEIMLSPRAIEAVRWPVRHFVLVQSLQGRSHYIELARWPLRG